MTDAEHDVLLAEFLRRQAATTRDTPRQEHLRIELLRRRIRPPSTEGWGTTVPQAVTVADLEAELVWMPADHPERSWCELELELAREHYELTPDEPFVRQVPAPALAKIEESR